MAGILLHVCCGPCSLMPIQHLREEGFAVTAFFFNPNIHPQEEYGLRLDAMRQAAGMLDIPLLTQGEAVDPQAWVTALGEDRAEGVRCRPCYGVRLAATARVAREQGFASFSTSLLYSRYQHHEDIVAEAEGAASEAGTTFLYRDFRPYWQAGVERSKEMGLYRQKWCGCLLSRGEAERQREEMRERRRLAKAERRG